MTSLVRDPGGLKLLIRGVSFGIDREGEEFFYSSLVDGQPSSISWGRLRDMAVYKLFNPFDVLVPMGGLSVSPAGKKLALRLGPPDVASLPAVLDLDTEKLTLLVPDDDARLEWLATIISAARTILISQVPNPVLGEDAIERPTLLPALGEIPVHQETRNRLLRLARLGRPLCDRPNDTPSDPEFNEILDEARLFFDYLKHDYPAALASLEAVETHATSAERRSRLLSLRAQIYMGMGDIERRRAQSVTCSRSSPARRGGLK